jgi:signal transduction histidine kinase
MFGKTKLSLSIRYKLIIGFVGVFVCTLLAYSLIILGFYNKHRQQTYFNRLTENATLLAQNVVDYSSNNQSLSGIFNTDNAARLRFAPGQAFIMLNESYDTVFTFNTVNFPNYSLTRKDLLKNITGAVNDTQVVAFKLDYNNKRLFIIASGFNDIGIERYVFLKKITIYYTLFCIILVIIVSYFYSEIILLPLRKMLFIINTITDKNLNKRLEITLNNDEIDKLGNTFNEMLDRLEKSFLLEKKFVSHAAHEYRTPLTTIKGQIEVALMSDRSVDYYKSLLLSINDDIDRLSGLQRALSDLMRVSVRNVATDFRFVPFVEIVADARDSVLKANKQFAISLVINEYPEDPDLSVVHGDQNLLRSALMNLMDNACKYSADKKCVVVVSFENKHIKVEVIDKGQGISEVEVKMVFEPFYRSADNTPTVHGYGVGLSLVKRIVEIHNSIIQVDSELGVGSKFTFIIPSTKFSH